jgi:tetratricopeptide (TPR) repeat protein
MTKRRDPMDRVIESALQPGRFIGWSQGASFVAGLGEVEREIAALTASSPARAAALYEAFIAACNLKAEEIDDSDGEFGMFAGSLFCGWIQARQAAGTDPGGTAEILLTWMKNDDYGFCNELGSDAVKVLDRVGMAAFEQAVRVRFEAACGERKQQAGNYIRDRWGQILRSIYAQQRSVEKYLDLSARTGLTQTDCETIATMLQAKRKPNEALSWLERGIEMENAGTFKAGTSYKLVEMRRALLAKLGRGREALDSAWAEFQAHPSKFTYDELLRYVPKSERGSWHEKAMAASKQGDLASLIELWLSVKETERLVERLNRVSDPELEGLSHYVTEPAAKHLARTHPAVAAKVFRALCVRILYAAKSKYYHEALANLEEARRCYQAAGLDERWRELVTEIRREHHRKSGFMPGFEAIVAGKRARIEPSFLDRARTQWARKTQP